jgi:hypothetical protein
MPADGTLSLSRFPGSVSLRFKQRVRIRCWQLIHWWSFDRANHHLWPAAKSVVPRSNPEHPRKERIKHAESRSKKPTRRRHHRKQ